MEREGASIGIGADGGDDVERFSYWIDVDAALEAVRVSGAPVIAEPEDQPWGERVAQTRDPAGNLVHLGAAL